MKGFISINEETKDKQGQTKGNHSYLHIKTFVNTKSLHLAKEIMHFNKADVTKAVSIFGAFVY